MCYSTLVLDEDYAEVAGVEYYVAHVVSRRSCSVLMRRCGATVVQNAAM